MQRSPVNKPSCHPQSPELQHLVFDLVYSPADNAQKDAWDLWGRSLRRSSNWSLRDCLPRIIWLVPKLDFSLAVLHFGFFAFFLAVRIWLGIVDVAWVGCIALHNLATIMSEPTSFLSSTSVFLHLIPEGGGMVDHRRPKGRRWVQ